MGQQNAFVDVAALRAVANRFDDTARLIDRTVQTQIAKLAFDSTTAGRGYSDRGDALRVALSRLAGALTQWARASGEIAATLRASADRYTDADFAAAGRVSFG
jgi:uncharacterized protein YukE